MRSYIQTMHMRTERQQKRFALFVSAGCTLAIFSVWSLVRFNYSSTTAGTTPQQAALIVATDQVGTLGTTRANTTTVTPFENLLNGIKESFGAMKSGVSDASSKVTNLGNSIQNEYTDARNTTIQQ